MKEIKIDIPAEYTKDLEIISSNSNMSVEDWVQDWVLTRLKMEREAYLLNRTITY